MGQNKGGRRPGFEVLAATALVRQSHGRNSKLSPEVLRDLLHALRKGFSYELACDYAGISYQTLRNWFNDVEKVGEDSVYFHAVRMIKQARTTLAHKATSKIEEALIDDWKAAAWALTNLFPRDVGPRKAVEISGPEGEPIHIVQQAEEILRQKLADLSEEELEKMATGADSGSDDS